MQLNDGIVTDKTNQELKMKKKQRQKTMFLLIFNDL